MKLRKNKLFTCPNCGSHKPPYGMVMDGDSVGGRIQHLTPHTWYEYCSSCYYKTGKREPAEELSNGV